MSLFGIIIHETTAGSNIQFVSTHLDINSTELKETITDERTLASQLANLSDVYSVQGTRNFKVYSLIVTNHTDFLGRSGFYAIRLYSPRGINLNNIESLLDNIKQKYISYNKSNSLSSQNYDDILSSILILENGRDQVVSMKGNVNCFHYFQVGDSSLSNVFNANALYLVNKIYAFNVSKAVSEQIATNSGLKSFALIDASHREIFVENTFGALQDLKINEQTVEFNPRLKKFTVVCQANALLTYNTTDDKSFKTISSNSISIEKKPNRPTDDYDDHYKNSKKRPKKSFFEFYGMYIITVSFILVIVIGGVYFLKNDPNEGQTSENDNISSRNDVNFAYNSISLERVVDSSKKLRDTSYIATLSNKMAYKLKFAKNKWTYYQNDKSFDFNETVLKDFKLGDQGEKDFKDELKKISKHPFLVNEPSPKKNEAHSTSNAKDSVKPKPPIIKKKTQEKDKKNEIKDESKTIKDKV